MNNETQKKLYKKREGKMFMGVLGGLADYLETDVTVLRIIYVILTLCSAFFPGFLLYIVMAFIMPFEASKSVPVKHPEVNPHTETPEKDSDSENKKADATILAQK